MKEQQQLQQMKSSVKAAFSKVREELSEHLESINENTNEINSNYEYMCEIDAKLGKIAERLDELEMRFLHPEKPRLQIQPLTIPEQELFIALYALSNEKELITLEDASRRSSMEKDRAKELLVNLVRKGVPILEAVVQGKTYYSLDKSFKDLQAKQNILRIREDMAKRMV